MEALKIAKERLAAFEGRVEYVHADYRTLVDILESHRQLMAAFPDENVRRRADDLLATATRHKHEIDYTLRHWATPVERARVEDRLGSLMRTGLRLREIRETPSGPSPEPLPAA